MNTIALTRRRAAPRIRTLPRLSRGAGFWAVAFAFLVLTAFATAPSPLYGLYAQQDHLAPLTITIVYAVYATGVVASLLLSGHVSDWYGRRAVLIPGLVVAATAALLFLVWHSLAGLLVARVLTGVALGASVATATAYIADLDAGALATYFTAGYVGVSLPVIGLGIALQYLSPRVVLLIFGTLVGVGFLAAAPVLAGAKTTVFSRAIVRPRRRAPRLIPPTGRAGTCRRGRSSPAPRPGSRAVRARR
jgi:MFS family permease